MQHFNLFTVFCLTVILGILPTIPCVRSVFRSFAKLLAVGLVLAISACGGGGGGTAAMSPSGNMPGDGMSPMTIPLPTPSFARTLADLNAYDTPSALTSAQLRTGAVIFSTIPIAGFRYDDADGNRQVLVERLEFAHLGLWVNGNFADNDFEYANLADNAVTLAADFSALGTAEYQFHGNFVYRGIRLYPHGFLTFNFSTGSLDGGFDIDSDFPDLYFGDANAMLPDNLGGMRPVNRFDTLMARVENGRFTANGFSARMVITQTDGFFSGLGGRVENALNGRFHHGNDYTQGMIPDEVSGTIDGFIGTNGSELRGGFIGQLQP